MALTATYQDGSIKLESATLRIGKIWGSKTEQWNAWINVFRNSADMAPSATFSIQAPYVDGENPYIALYKVLGSLSFLSDVSSDDVNHVQVKTTPAPDAISSVVEEVKKATKRTKK